jgi:aldehyde:ferredoxin oxidoreductase
MAEGEAQIACIGPAGEKLVKFASIVVNRGRAAGRCGLGAVMGSKNLKAIAIRGTGVIEKASPQTFENIISEVCAPIKANPRTATY